MRRAPLSHLSTHVVHLSLHMTHAHTSRHVWALSAWFRPTLERTDTEEATHARQHACMHKTSDKRKTGPRTLIQTMQRCVARRARPKRCARECVCARRARGGAPGASAAAASAFRDEAFPRGSASKLSFVVVDEMNDYYDPTQKRATLRLLQRRFGDQRCRFVEADICDRPARPQS